MKDAKLPTELLRDRGWKAKGICLDGPLARVGIGRKTAEGEEVHIRVDAEKKVARYLNVGKVPEVPPADGVGLKFLGYVGESSDDSSKVLGASETKGGATGGKA